MSAGAFFWDAYADLAAEAAVYLHPGGYAVIEFGQVRPRLSMHAHTPAGCDTVIQAMLTAKDLLLGAQAPKPPAKACPICGAALEPGGVCKVCTAVPIGEYPVSELACGCAVQDAVPIDLGTPMVCEKHGETEVIAAPAEVAG